MALLTVGGVAQKTPKKMKVSINDIDGETTRNAQGNMIRDRITTKRKIELEFPPLTHAELNTLLNAVSSVFFTVTYPDPYATSDPTVLTTKTFYVGDRSAPMYKFGTGSVAQVLWEGLKMNLIEQ